MHRLLIPPISTRQFEGFESKTEWIATYYQYRGILDSKGLKLNSAEFLNSIGKNSSVLVDRFRGSLLGLAVGDALGTTLEFSQRGDDDRHTEMVGGGPFNLKPGQWTDDTSMALCLAHSLYETNSFNADHQMTLYVEWWRNGFLSSNGRCFDIGMTVRQALAAYESSGNAFSGSADEYSAGNGSLMRLCPVVLFFASKPAKAIEMAGVSSKTTHANIECIDACRYFAALILGCLEGKTKDEILQPSYSPVENLWVHDPLTKKVRDIANGSYKNKSRDEIKSSGYVINSLEAALWAFYHSSSFEEGLVKAVNLAGDADTIGAIYGQLAGAYYGEMAIPFKYIKPLSYYHYFYFFAEEFVGFYTGRSQLISIK